MEVHIDKTILEDKIEGDMHSVHRLFVDVASAKNYHCFSEGLDTNLILKSMSLMKLSNRERGSGACKFNTINRRWFKKEMNTSVGKNEEVNRTIERGSVVNFCGVNDYFLVFEAWKQMGIKKMCP